MTSESSPCKNDITTHLISFTRSLANGFMNARNVTISVPDLKTNKRTTVETNIKGRGDPGYTLTASTYLSAYLFFCSSNCLSAVMISEAALALFLDKARLPAISRDGGVLTPVTGLGDVLIERLLKSGRWEVESHVVGES